MDKDLKNWNKTKKVLEKEFLFENFKEAMKFVNEVAEIAEQENHHPNMEIYDSNKVKISLTTHDADNGEKVTEKDFDLAVKINSCDY